MPLSDLARLDTYGEDDPFGATAAAERLQRKYLGRNIAGTYEPQPAGPELDPFVDPRPEQVSARETLQQTPLWQERQMQAGLPLVRGLGKTAEAVAFPGKYMAGPSTLYPPGSEEAQFLEDSRQRSATDWGRKNAFNYVFDPIPAGVALAAGQSLRGTMGSVGAGAGQSLGALAKLPDTSLAAPYVIDPQRVYKPGVYKDPRTLALESERMVEPEHESLKQLFGVTRDDLYQIGQQGARPGNRQIKRLTVRFGMT
jgi:hypothetical protein